MALQSAFVEHDEVIQTLPADAAKSGARCKPFAKENVALTALAACPSPLPDSRTHDRRYGHDRAANSAVQFPMEIVVLVNSDRVDKV
jgi:hypothetical protein